MDDSFWVRSNLLRGVKLVSMKYALIQNLSEEFKPFFLSVRDNSHLHAGHKGVDSNENTHFEVCIVSDAFAGQSLVNRHRMVNKSCASFFSNGMHALNLKLLTLKEW